MRSDERDFHFSGRLPQPASRVRRRRLRLRGGAFGIFLLGVATALAGGETSPPAPRDRPLPLFAHAPFAPFETLRPPVHLERPGGAEGPPTEPLAASAPADRGPKTARLFLGTTFLATPALGYVLWWKGDLEVRFNGNAEGWFGRDTYAGGADKANHFFIGQLAYSALDRAYRNLGHSPSKARVLGVLNVAAASLVVELGDGFTDFGFSWEDAAVTAAGGLAAASIAAAGWEDTLGFRFGRVGSRRVEEGPGEEGRTAAEGRSRDPDPNVPAGYSKDIYTADIKLSGLLPRLGLKPGVARYLLFSGTFGTKGYRFAPPSRRQRNVGVEVGLNLPEILASAGVTDRTWWGKTLRIVFTYFRVPYTAFGYRYDLNSRRWRGPDTGEVFDPGP